MKKSELWKQLVDEVGDEEVERAASVSVAEAEAELRAAGVDVAAERAKAEAFLDALAKGSVDEAPQPEKAEAREKATPRTSRPPPRERRQGPPPAVVLFGTAVVAAAAGAAIYAATHRPQEQPVAPLPSPTTGPTFVPSMRPPDLVVAADLRRQAAADRDAQAWDDCLAHLDQARALDPSGDDAPGVKKLRDEAIRGILGKPKPPR